ncbi:unnamed protein product [Ilex paraguariensis]|uniref:Glycosyltransferase n=1 Tax=Ilex paraguariensis TaxID=185542 RepID=A0ABC8U593_9AQUA
MEDTIVLYPSPGIGHLVSTVELGKLILTHQPSFSIIIFITDAPYNTGTTGPYISRVSATCPSITFHHLPTISPPPKFTFFEDLAFEVPRLNNPNVHQALQTISQKSKLKAFIIDFFCNASFEVSTSLNIPTYYFYTSGAFVLTIFFYLPTIDKTTTGIKDLSYVEVPGAPPLSPSAFPEVFLHRNSVGYKNFVDTANNMAKSSGIITNTFESLEPRAVKAISEGKCITNGPTPPVYYIGPLIASNAKTNAKSGSEDECLTWLNSQPSQSVVFLCFGSNGVFIEEQLKEMAVGLENSGNRFLWVVRSPPTNDKASSTSSEPDLDALLPEGFLERTKDRGLVVKAWAPQLDVLSHDSVGGFVTHCGWNSVLEAVCSGVPMVTWPLYAEQRLNRVFLVEEMKVALPLDESEDGFVSSAELERRVRELMDSESGKAVRDQVKAMRDEARAALAENGSSRVALERLTESWKQG